MGIANAGIAHQGMIVTDFSLRTDLLGVNVTDRVGHIGHNDEDSQDHAGCRQGKDEDTNVDQDPTTTPTAIAATTTAVHAVYTRRVITAHGVCCCCSLP
jgi:hypothetical protein